MTYICMEYQYIVNMKTLGEQIKVRRTVLKIRQQELADLAGVSINTVVAIERGTGNPCIETLVSVCDVLGLQIVTKLKD